MLVAISLCDHSLYHPVPCASSHAAKSPLTVLKHRLRPEKDLCESLQSIKCRPFIALLQWTAPVVPTRTAAEQGQRAGFISVLQRLCRHQTAHRPHTGVGRLTWAWAPVPKLSRKKRPFRARKNLLEKKTTRACRLVDGTQVTHKRRPTENGLCPSTRAQTGRASGQIWASLSLALHSAPSVYRKEPEVSSGPSWSLGSRP